MSATSSEKTRRGPKSKREIQQYEWNDHDGAQWLLALLVGAAIAGHAIRVGHTRDGGALALAIYKDGEYGVEYVAPGDDLSIEVREIAAGWGIDPAMWDDTAGRWIAP